MLTPDEAGVARAAAATLEAEMPEGFGQTVEAEIAAGPGDRRPGSYEPATLIALGGLLVSATSLAWTIYKDLKKQTARPAEAVVVRKVRLQLKEQGLPEDARSDRMIEVVVAEVIKADPS
jgi:hypothetical protein